MAILTTRAKSESNPCPSTCIQWNIIQTQKGMSYQYFPVKFQHIYKKLMKLILFFFLFDDSILYVEMQRPRKAKSIFQEQTYTT